MKRMLSAWSIILLAGPVLLAQTTPPPVSIILYGRHGHITPHRHGCVHTGGGITDVAQPSPDTVIVTVNGAAVATGWPGGSSEGSMDFDVEQCFAVQFDKVDVKFAKLTVEARVIGLLRSDCHCQGKKSGTAEESEACAKVSAGPAELVSICAPSHTVTGGENLSINDRGGPACVPILPGKYTLHMVWHIKAQHPCSILPCHPASAEFAPDPAIDPLWLSYKEPFHGAQKKDFGFQVILRVAVENLPNGEKKEPEPLPVPMKDKGEAEMK